MELMVISELGLCSGGVLKGVEDCEDTSLAKVSYEGL